MVENATQRKLTAVLSADVKGCSKLMGEYDDTTVDTILRYERSRIIFGTEKESPP